MSWDERIVRLDVTMFHKLPSLLGLVLIWGLLPVSTATGQFSPGDLSRSHEKLEGSGNCTKCHEVGQEISGTKCLGCHQEIGLQMAGRHGFHFSHATTPCVECHKEHLGRDAATIRFDEKLFDHRESGFTLAGKHALIACTQCHSPEHITDPTVKKTIAEFPHKTYLGLSVACISCHKDPHSGRFKDDCSSCHDAQSWKTVTRFDHALTRYPLGGKHRNVQCNTCHLAFDAKDQAGQARFTTKSFADCTPCHTTPHAPSFSTKECRSCHTTNGWEAAMKEPFDHRLTKYILRERHAVLRCDQCHKLGATGNFEKVFKIAYRQCMDCHQDKHSGEFKQVYHNDCSACHTESGYRPSTFSISSHQKARFTLTGAHTATLCSSCHRNKETFSSVFRLKSFSCESCHEDTHRGQFKQTMAEKSCAACHSTSRWDIVEYDHSKTNFQLLGKHSRIACSACHKRSGNPPSTMVFEKVSSNCESCHEDVHMGQLVAAGRTDCSRCHDAENWQARHFDHQKQTSFSLKGGHEKVLCRACHKEETLSGKSLTRFKPLSGRCESCHSKG